jgi:hypothetical protein
MDHTLRDGPGDPFICPPGAVSLIRIAPIARAPYGYARVSTDGQTLAAQDAALPGAGCAKVFSENASGAKADRADLRKVVSRLNHRESLGRTRFPTFFQN